MHPSIPQGAEASTKKADMADRALLSLIKIMAEVRRSKELQQIQLRIPEVLEQQNAEALAKAKAEQLEGSISV